ncbi:carboxypeptidase-like regulatory domain-containing protein [Candidatus Nitronereus thalassa]|uniref:Carboxypeptidase-like regulatory domain-containing protein n=1 Tax=Candidatus Nitronereus thalassa TaxID=3020898 RepID=A0ABU3K5H3_9BACT|nr:carboxypeptidase-like regulatory domain-containing protein [Candidatus Nitronereus thalassa]MDT7041616.1 carboxypeptidase-like regulatory domain-containing protein [Candidatus Nitronereus thalassa]
MTSWTKGILVLILALGMIGGTASLSLAVYGDGAGDGGQLTDSKGKPMANVKVRITQRNPDGTRTVRETETDDRGFFMLPWTGGPVTNLQFGSGGKWYTFGGPFHDMREVLPSERPGTCSECEILDFHLPDADSVASAPSDGVWVTGASGHGGDFPRYKLGINYGYKFGRMNTTLDRGGNISDGDDIIVGQSELRFDGRVYYGPLFNLGYLGNFGNLGNFLFGPLGNVGNIGNVGKIGISDCYGGVQVGIGVSAKDTGLNKDEHPGTPDGRKDTFLKQKYKGSIKPYVGCKVADFNNFGYFNLQAGPTFSFWEYVFMSDEAGNLRENQLDDTKLGASFGVEYNNHFDYGNLGGLLGPRDQIYGGLQLSYWTEYVEGFDVRTVSPLPATYISAVEGAWISTFYAGWGMYF